MCNKYDYIHANARSKGHENNFNKCLFNLGKDLYRNIPLMFVENQ